VLFIFRNVKATKIAFGLDGARHIRGQGH